MLTDTTFVKMTNTVDPKSQQSPANQFIHARKLANASSKDVVTPNGDTNLFANKDGFRQSPCRKASPNRQILHGRNPGCLVKLHRRP